MGWSSPLGRGRAAIASFLVASALIVSACGGPAAAPSPSATTGATASSAATAAPVTISVMCRCVKGGVNTNVVTWLQDTVIPAYTKANPNVTVNVTQFGGSDEEMKARMALDLKAGKGDDVMSFDGFWIPEFASGGLLKPLSDVAGADVASWEGWSHIPKSVQALLQYQNKQYGVPSGTDVRGIWFRKDVFQKAGLPADWQPKSWDDIFAAADAIKAKVPGVTPMQVNAGTAMGEATTMQGFYPLIASAGGWIFDFDTNKFVAKSQAITDALGFYQKVYANDTYGDSRLQILKDGRNRSFADFRDGKIAMLWEGDYLWRSVLASGQFKLDNRNALVGFAKIPAKTPGKGYRGQDFVTVSGGGGWVLNPNTKQAKAAWAFLATAYSKVNVDAFEKLEAKIPVRDDVAVPGDEVMTGLVKMLPLTVVRPNNPTYPKVSDAAQLATQQVVQGTSPQQAADAYAATVTQVAGKDNVESK